MDDRQDRYRDVLRYHDSHPARRKRNPNVQDMLIKVFDHEAVIETVTSDGAVGAP